MSTNQNTLPVLTDEQVQELALKLSYDRRVPLKSVEPYPQMTETGSRVMWRAMELAHIKNQENVTPMLLLRALVEDATGFGKSLTRHFDQSGAIERSIVEKGDSERIRESFFRILPLSPTTQEIVQKAFNFAGQHGYSKCNAAYLLLGLVAVDLERRQENVRESLLLTYAIEPQDAYDYLLSLLGQPTDREKRLLELADSYMTNWFRDHQEHDKPARVVVEVPGKIKDGGRVVHMPPEFIALMMVVFGKEGDGTEEQLHRLWKMAQKK